MGFLNEDIRYSTCDALIDSAKDDLDISFLSEEDILAMFKPNELIQLTFRLVTMLEDKIPNKIDDLAVNGDADSGIVSQFFNVDSFVKMMQHVAYRDKCIVNRLEDLEWKIEEAKSEVEARKSEDEDEGSFFTKVPSATLAKETATRSIFSDVDE
jgi:hypothetical protein